MALLNGDVKQLGISVGRKHSRSKTIKKKKRWNNGAD